MKHHLKLSLSFLEKRVRESWFKTAVLFVLLSVLFPTVSSCYDNSVKNARYVSFSEGDDRNDGTSSEKPWKTLSKVSKEVFGPGAVIYLKRGDVWNDALIPRGNGDMSSNQWITVKPYGPENNDNPTIDRKNAADANKDWAIKLVDLQAWRLENLTIKNAKTGIVYIGSKETEKKKGLQIIGCKFYNIRGLANHAKTPEEDKRTYWFLRGSTAISLTGQSYCKDGLPATDANCCGNKSFYVGSWGSGLSDVLIDNVFIDNATYGMWICAGGFSGGLGKNYQIRKPHIVNAGIGAIDILFVENGSITEPKIAYAGGDGCWSGTFGIDINYSKDFTVQGGDIAYTQAKVFGGGDGEAINLCGPNKNVKIIGVNMHHNDGAAITLEGADPNDNATYEFSRNRVWDNALSNDHPAPGQYEYPEFLLAMNPSKTKSSAVVKDNWIKKKANRHLMMVVDGVTPNVWKDDFSMVGEKRFPPGYSFSNNQVVTASNDQNVAASKYKAVTADESPKDTRLFPYACETLDGWFLTDVKGKVSRDELSVTRQPGTFKTGSGAVEWKSPGQKNLFKVLVTPVVLTNFKLLELDLWSKEKALLTMAFDDRDGASFNCPIELKGGEWEHVKLRPTDFKLNDDSKVKKASVDPTKLSSGLAVVYMDPFIGADHPNTFRIDSISAYRVSGSQ